MWSLNLSPQTLLFVFSCDIFFPLYFTRRLTLKALHEETFRSTTRTLGLLLGNKPNSLPLCISRE